MKLYIIGNGFDLYHDIKSSYYNFRDFLKKNDPEVYEVVDKYLGGIENFWSEFEKNLAYLDEDTLLDHASNYLVSYGAEDWSDAYHYDYQYEMEQIITALTDGLKRNFAQWACKIEITTNKPLLDLDRNALFLTFNYTPTLEKLYRIAPAKINHIHGVVEGDDSDIVFGHGYIQPEMKPDLEKIRREQGEQAYNDYLDDLSAEDVRIRKGREILDSYFPNTFKPTKDIIQANEVYFASLKLIDEVIIIGHSLGDVDVPYFQEICNSLSNPKAIWKVTHYCDNEIDRQNQTLVKIGVRKDQIKNIRTQDLCAQLPALF
jgi:hypothetical protein